MNTKIKTEIRMDVQNTQKDGATNGSVDNHLTKFDN